MSVNERIIEIKFSIERKEKDIFIEREIERVIDR